MYPLPEAICVAMETCNFVGKMLLTSIISISNYTFIVCIVFDLEGYMSPHYNVLPEAVCCCLLVNHVVYKHVTMTSLLWLRIPTHPQNILSYGCRTEEEEEFCT